MWYGVKKIFELFVYSEEYTIPILVINTLGTLTANVSYKYSVTYWYIKSVLSCLVSVIVNKLHNSQIYHTFTYK